MALCKVKYAFSLVELEYLGHAVFKKNLKLTLHSSKQFKSVHSLTTLESFCLFLAWRTNTTNSCFILPRWQLHCMIYFIKV